MKKLIPLLFLCLLLIMSCSSQNGKTSSHPFPTLTAGEDTLNTSSNNIPQGTGTTEINCEDSCLSIANSIGTTTSLRPYDEWMDTLALDSLHTLAHGFILPTGHYITALQVVFGIDSNYHFILFFKPIALSRVTYTASQSTANYSVTPSSLASNAYYTFDTISHHLMPASLGYVNTTTANFKTYIRISQTVTHPVPGGFNPAQDSTGSTTSVILSFQEIFDFILQNDSAAKASSKPFHSLNIFNTCIKYPVVIGTSRDTLIKEDVMLGINNCNIYEDLGHLCPPSCAELIYPVYITQ